MSSFCRIFLICRDEHFPRFACISSPFTGHCYHQSAHWRPTVAANSPPPWSGPDCKQGKTGSSLGPSWAKWAAMSSAARDAALLKCNCLSQTQTPKSHIQPTCQSIILMIEQIRSDLNRSDQIGTDQIRLPHDLVVK